MGFNKKNIPFFDFMTNGDLSAVAFWIFLTSNQTKNGMVHDKFVGQSVRRSNTSGLAHQRQLSFHHALEL